MIKINASVLIITGYISIACGQITWLHISSKTRATNRILFGDGKGNFTRDMVISEGIDLHESEITDLDGDGDLDILGKPYDGDAPGLDIWLQNGTGRDFRPVEGADKR